MTGMECLRYELGEPDDSGRRRPVEIKGSEFVMDVRHGHRGHRQRIQPADQADHAGARQPTSGATSSSTRTARPRIDRVYAGGDIVLGPPP